MFEEIKYFIQRGRKGYSEKDTWDFHSYLSEIIPSAIRQYREKGTGCPSGLWDKEAKNDECHRWHEVLEEIAQGFEAAEEINNSFGCRYKKELKDGAFTYEYDKKRAKLLTEKYNRGMDLFKKYFLNLWD